MKKIQVCLIFLLVVSLLPAFYIFLSSPTCPVSFSFCPVLYFLSLTYDFGVTAASAQDLPLTLHSREQGTLWKWVLTCSYLTFSCLSPLSWPKCFTSLEKTFFTFFKIWNSLTFGDSLGVRKVTETDSNPFKMGDFCT